MSGPLDQIIARIGWEGLAKAFKESFVNPDFTAAPQTSVTSGMERVDAQLELIAKLVARMTTQIDLIERDVAKLRDNLVPHLVEGRDYDFHPANQKS